MKARFYTLAFVILGGTVAAQGSAFVITPTFDPDLTVAEQNAINAAISSLEADFNNPIDVPIYFQGTSSGLGGSNFPFFDPSYTEFYRGLVANNANPAAIQALNANGGDALTNGGVNPVNGSSTIMMKAPEMRALDPNGTLGLYQAPACQLVGASGNKSCGGNSGPAYDGVISLNTGITFPPNPNNGGNYDLTSVAEHEIDEILGLGSNLSNTNSTANSNYNGTDTGNGDPSAEDLYRWNASTGGTRTLSTNCANPTLAYFSYGPSTGPIAQFNNKCNGADFADWCSDGSCAPNVGPQVQDAFASPGQSPRLGPSEIDALTAIGFTSAIPEPATFFPVAGILGFMVFRHRRNR